VLAQLLGVVQLLVHSLATTLRGQRCRFPAQRCSRDGDNLQGIESPIPKSTMPTDSLLTLKLPEGYTFADLKIRRWDDAIDLDMDLVKLICNLNGLDFEKVCQNPGPVVTTILTVWYKSHLAGGGEPDALMEELKSQGKRSN
jgi:hypothetical protein